MYSVLKFTGISEPKLLSCISFKPLVRGLKEMVIKML